MSADFIQTLKHQLKTKGVLTLNIKVTPSAPRSEIFNQLSDGTLKVRLQTPPVNGKANKALIKLLEKEFNAEVIILRGETSARKLIKISV